MPDVPYKDDITQAVETARYFNRLQQEIRKPEYWCGHAIVRKDDGRIAVYSADAWDEPSEVPMLRWFPPTGQKLAHVDIDGKVTHHA